MNPLIVASLYVLVGFVGLVLGGELLVRGASGMASLLKIAPLVIGLTVVAFGTSAPELAVAIRGTLAGEADISMGNIVGSNIFNILGVLGCSALVAPLIVSSQLIRTDVPLMVAVSFIAWLVCSNGNVSRVEGAMLFALLVGYTIWLIFQSRRERQQAERQAAAAAEVEPAVHAEEIPGFIPPDTKPTTGLLLKLVGFVLVGLVLLSIGASLLVDGASTLAREFGVSELMIGLTIVAIGTSLPEAATSVMASLRGERDIAVGNVVGSNLFNILSVLGLTALVTPAGVAVSPTAIGFDIPVMIAVAVACLPIFFSHGVITRWEGGLFVFYYGLYTTYLIMTADGVGVATWYQTLLWAVIPLTVIALVANVISSVRQARAADR